MSRATISEAAKAVVRRNTEEVQGRGNFESRRFADNFIDHTPQPDMTHDKAGVRKLYGYIRAAFTDFRAEIHWQLADGDRVTTYRRTTARMKVISLASRRLTARFTSRLLTSCVSRTAESPTTGESAIFCRSCSRSAGGLRRQKHK